MRTRTRSIVNVPGFLNSITGLTTDYNCAGGTVITPAYTSPIYNDPLYFKGFTETMIDYTGKGQNHAVWHRRKTRDINTTGLGHFLTGNGAPYGYKDWSNAFIPHWPRYYNTRINPTWDTTKASGNLMPARWSVDPLTSIDETSLKQDVLDKARHLDADILLDLVEGNQIWPAIRDSAMTLENLRANWGKARKVIKTASNSYLAWTFGIAPLVSDAVAIWNSLPKMVEDVKKHTNGELRRYSRTAELRTFFDSSPATELINSQKYVETFPTGRIVKPPTVRYVLVVKPNTHYSSDFFKKADYVLSRFATSPARLAWEKVPFSFVLDWFVDIRSMLDTLDKMVGFSPYDIVGFTRSYSYELTSSHVFATYNTCNSNLLAKGWAGDVTFKHYERSLVSNGANAPVWKPRFGKNQAAVTAALIGQRINRLTRRR